MSWIRACAIDDVPDGEAVCVSVGSCPAIAVWNSGGEYIATADTCTHENASLAENGYLDDGAIECGLHMARFDARTGKALQFPAEIDLLVYPTKVEGDAVFVEVTP
ncbi:non-heme iron oxygenase ferredoxin subunit [Nocardia sp. NPDC052112]|uniref:non-heme iron oxygenase ferredoxin subunit n=1 Tax=Nocardia sp. NPDC052112 TaxID=3155646 RepID=UPI00343EB654